MKTLRMARMKNGRGLVLLRTLIGRAWWLPVLFLLATTATSLALQSGDFTYTINDDNTINITGYTGPGGAVIIPSTMAGKTVTSIGSGTFRYNTSMISVTIPDSVTTIWTEAFQYCPDLMSVTIGNGVTYIQDAAFQDCYILMGVYFEGNAPSLGSGVFDSDNHATVYYKAGTTGWGTTFGGRPTAVWHAIIKAHGTAGGIIINYPEAVSITVEMNAGADAGINKDWWVVALAGSSWYYLNSSVQWTQFDGNLSHCHPAYQGGLFNLPATQVLNMSLPAGLYTFWFAVDQMDGILNVGGPILVDSVNVIVQ